MTNNTPLRAIRLKCIDCCCGSVYEPAKCTAVRCPLHPFRTGHRPGPSNDPLPAGSSEEPPENQALAAAEEPEPE